MVRDGEDADNPWPALIRSLRDRLGDSQEALAERIGCDQTAVSRWEAGARKPLGRNARELRRLAADTAAGEP